MREFDQADRDPAKTAKELNSFEDTLRKLFVDGYILVPDSQRDPAASREGSTVSPSKESAECSIEAKMLTQIVFEQLEDIVELRYGSKVHVLWNGGSKKTCQESMRQIGQVVDDCLQRLRADFAEKDLYMALEAMDMRAWAGATGPKLLSLREKARRLCSAAGLTYSWETWRGAIRFVERERRRRPDANVVDNRAVWAAAFAASQGQDPSPLAGFRPLVAFYISLTDGTGNIERFLGTHACFLAHHVGGPDAEMSEVCLEIAKEGPKIEEELFAKDAQKPGVLLLTDFSRRCAQLWRALHGRRFGCYKERTDKGKRHTGLRLHGSMKAVALMQQRATRNLVTIAQADEAALASSRGVPPRQTLVGIERKKLMRRVREGEVAPPSKKLLSFRRTTAQRKQMKGLGVWLGFGPKAPALRSKLGETASVSMVGIPTKTSVQSPVARDIRSRIARIAFPARRNAFAAEPSPQKRSRVEPAAMATCSQHELYTQDLDSNALLKGLSIIVFSLQASSDVASQTRPAASQGAVVLTSAASRSQTSQHVPAILNAAKLHFTTDFCRKHQAIVRKCREAIKRTDSKWQESSVTSSGVWVLENLRAFQSFLRSVRRLRPAAGVHATFLDSSRTFERTSRARAVGSAQPLWRMRQ